MEFTSIIFLHFAQNEARSKLAKESLESLRKSIKSPCEIIVVDNGGSYEDSVYFLDKIEKNEITHYIRNADNIFFGRARNKAIEMSEGKYIAVVDNDLFYKEGWLEKCLEVLKKTEGEKLMVTPMRILYCHKRYTSKRMVNGEEFKVNTFAGSNCWVMRRNDWEEIGGFEDHPLAGTLWCRKYAKKGYGVIVIENLVEDRGDKHMETYGYKQHLAKTQGLQLHQIDIKKRLVGGEEIIYWKYVH